MNKRARKHLEIALGGNMNIATLKPLALIEIMTDFAKREVEAINYTHCSLKLEDFNSDVFEDWTLVNGYHKFKNFYLKNGKHYSEQCVLQKYKEYLQKPLIL